MLKGLKLMDKHPTVVYLFINFFFKGFGFWSRDLTAAPKRLLKKPSWMMLARFTVTKEYQDMKDLGDRTLAIFIGKGFYHFTTYNMNNNAVNNIQNIDYGSALEGVWNFIYFSYSGSRLQATGFVKFAD